MLKPASVPLMSARALGNMRSKSLSTLLKVRCSKGRTHTDNGLAGEDRDLSAVGTMRLIAQ